MVGSLTGRWPWTCWCPRVAGELVLEALADVIVQGHVPGQDPGHVDVCDAGQGGAGVDQGVGVVVSVDYPVVAVRCVVREPHQELGWWTEREWEWERG